MERRVLIELITETYSVDSMGVPVTLESKNIAYARMDNVSLNEIAEGGRIGLNPECRFTVFFGDYHGEKIVKCNGTRYTVYRAPQYGDNVNLYCELRKGNA